MVSNTSKDEKHVRKQRSNRMKIFLPLIIIAVLAIILYVKLNDSPKKSTVDGVSDEVYEQLVQFYFFTTTFMDFYLEDELSETEEWMEGHELYEQAEEYAKEDRKSTRLNSSHVAISYAVFCLKKKKKQRI